MAVPALSCDDFVARVMAPRNGRDVYGALAVIDELGLTETEAGHAATATWFFEGCVGLLRAFDGVVETVEKLGAQYRLGVIMNGGGKMQRLKWLQLNLPIELIIVSGEFGIDKPDPRIFAHACSLAEVSTPEAVFVGDRLDVDIAGAKAAGMRAVWFNHWGGSLDGASPAPDAVIERFVELPAVLAGL